MFAPAFLAKARQHLAVATSLFALIANLGTPLPAAAEDHEKHGGTSTPIKHVIVIIGENRTFDHVFATYQPRHGESVSNLLSKGIVNCGRNTGPQLFPRQPVLRNRQQPRHVSTQSLRQRHLFRSASGACRWIHHAAISRCRRPPWRMKTVLPSSYYIYLTTGGTGLAHGAVDTRIPNAAALPSGPFQITSATHPYDAYDNSPVHRFYQMWQQFDCNAANATRSNPTGCRADLFPWVETTIGAGSNGLPQPAGFNDTSTKEGSTSMGFYNVQRAMLLI